MIFKIFKNLVSIIFTIVIVIVLVFFIWQYFKNDDFHNVDNLLKQVNFVNFNSDLNIHVFQDAINLFKDIYDKTDNTSQEELEQPNNNNHNHNLDIYDILLHMPDYSKIQVVILKDRNKVVYSAEMVHSAQARIQGLMYRDKLDDYTGMFFVMPGDTQSPFWMKNVRFNLDILFIDKNFSVIDIKDDVPGCSKDDCPYYTPRGIYRYVLEIPGGSSDFNNIRIGDKIELIIDNFK